MTSVPATWSGYCVGVVRYGLKKQLVGLSCRNHNGSKRIFKYRMKLLEVVRANWDSLSFCTVTICSLFQPNTPHNRPRDVDVLFYFWNSHINGKFIQYCINVRTYQLWISFCQKKTADQLYPSTVHWHLLECKYIYSQWQYVVSLPSLCMVSSRIHCQTQGSLRDQSRDLFGTR